MRAFNPSLVRLAHHAPYTLLLYFVPFNPSLVRLAPTMGERSTLSASLSIPAWFDWRVLDSPYVIQDPLPFNPSLVRLALVA